MPIQFHFDGDKLNGTLYYLFTKYGNNYNGYVNATCSSYYSNFIPYNAIDFDQKTIWHPTYEDNLPGEYVQINLLKNFMTLEGYTIQTSNNPVGSSHPRDWAFSASEDNQHWTKEYRYIDTEGYMNYNLRKLTLPVSIQGKYKHFRFIVTGPSHNPQKDDYRIRMDVNQIELFGVLYNDNEHISLFITCSLKHNNFFFNYLLFITVKI